MNSENGGYPHRKIKAQSGQVELAAGMFFILFLALFMHMLLQIDMFRAAAGYMEDALAASNLASAVIDVEEYGISHNVVIDNPILAYERYCYALKENLNLNEEWRCANGKMIGGPVRIEEYIVYNCADGKVEAYQVNESGVIAQWGGAEGEVAAPNGIIVENTGVFSAVSFETEGFLGVKATAKKGKLVDIALNDIAQ